MHSKILKPNVLHIETYLLFWILYSLLIIVSYFLLLFVVHYLYYDYLLDVTFYLLLISLNPKP